MKKLLFSVLLISSISVIAQPITNISTLNSSTSNFVNQGFFISVTVDSLINQSTWMVHDATGNIPCDFSKVSSPTKNSKITIVGLGKLDNGFKVQVNYYYSTSNPPNIAASIVDILANPKDGHAVKLKGSITGILNIVEADYFFDDPTGTIEADFDVNMSVPDLYHEVELWGVIDNPSPGYVDVDVWAWYSTSVAGIEEFSSSFKIFPNPASNWINYDLPNSITKLAMVDALGKTVLLKEIGSHESSFNIENLASGIYVISFFENSQIVGQQKIVIRK